MAYLRSQMRLYNFLLSDGSCRPAVKHVYIYPPSTMQAKKPTIVANGTYSSSMGNGNVIVPWACVP